MSMRPWTSWTAWRSTRTISCEPRPTPSPPALCAGRYRGRKHLIQIMTIEVQRCAVHLTSLLLTLLDAVSSVGDAGDPHQ